MSDRGWRISGMMQKMAVPPYLLESGDLIGRGSGSIRFVYGVDRSYAQERLIEKVKEFMRKELIEEHGDFFNQVLKHESIQVEMLREQNGILWGEGIARGLTAPRRVVGIEVTVEWSCIGTLLHDQKSNQWKKSQQIFSRVPQFSRIGG